MVKSGDVSSDKSKFEEAIKECSERFAELNSSWKGPSYKGIKASVDSFVSEAQLISTQMTSLAGVCQDHEAYCVQVAKWEEAKRIYDDAERQAQAEAAKGEYADQGFIDSCHKEMERQKAIMKQAEEEMRKLVTSAQSKLSGIKGEIKEVTFQPVSITSV